MTDYVSIVEKLFEATKLQFNLGDIKLRAERIVDSNQEVPNRICMLLSGSEFEVKYCIEERVLSVAVDAERYLQRELRLLLKQLEQEIHKNSEVAPWPDYRVQKLIEGDSVFKMPSDELQELNENHYIRGQHIAGLKLALEALNFAYDVDNDLTQQKINGARMLLNQAFTEIAEGAN